MNIGVLLGAVVAVVLGVVGARPRYRQSTGRQEDRPGRRTAHVERYSRRCGSRGLATTGRRGYVFLLAVAATLLHNVVHESVHVVASPLLAEPVEAFRLFANGWGTSQVDFATPVEARHG